MVFLDIDWNIVKPYVVASHCRCWPCKSNVITRSSFRNFMLHLRVPQRHPRKLAPAATTIAATVYSSQPPWKPNWCWGDRAAAPHMMFIRNSPGLQAFLHMITAKCCNANIAACRMTDVMVSLAASHAEAAAHACSQQDTEPIPRMVP